MRAPPRRVVAFVIAVAGLGLFGLGRAVAAAPIAGDARQWALAVICGGMVLLARRAPIAIGPNQHLMVGLAPIFAATLLLPAPSAIATAALAVIAADRSRRASWLQAAFNGGSTALQVAAGAGVFAVLAGGSALAGLPSAQVVAIGVAMATAMYAVNVGLVETIVALQHGSFSARAAWRRHRGDPLSDGALYVLGLLIALLAALHLWAVLLLAVPTLLVYRTLRDSHALQQQLAHRATHDELTNLGNRARFGERAARALARSARTGGELAVIFLDIDSFKRVNDTLGHSVGDELLRVLARRLAACLAPGETVARLGGDEFIVLLEESDLARAAATAARLLAALREPAAVAGRQLLVEASAGVVVGGGGESVDDLLRSADIAMYWAKAQGKGRYEIFQPAMEAAVRERVALESELRRAVERGELTLRYQPIIDLADGRVAGCEALVRWQHPERGLVMPGEFIALAEETGLIVPIGHWVLREACTRQQRWQAAHAGHGPLSISINLSARQLADPECVAAVARVLAESGVQPRSVILEVTESVMMDDAEAALRSLVALQALGVRLALDDFGTGYSSLSYLHRFPFEIIKIDKAFVEPLAAPLRRQSLAGIIVEMALLLRQRTVAEGVETAAQAEAVRRLGCDYGQGYHFGRPLTAEAMEALLAADRAALDAQGEGARLRSAS